MRNDTVKQFTRVATWRHWTERYLRLEWTRWIIIKQDMHWGGQTLFFSLGANYLRPQLFVLHSCVCWFSPSHFFPPPAGLGLLHFRVLNLCPPPHVTEHFPYLLHFPHLPSTKKAHVVKLEILLHLKFNLSTPNSIFTQNNSPIFLKLSFKRIAHSS